MRWLMLESLNRDWLYWHGFVPLKTAAVILERSSRWLKKRLLDWGDINRVCIHHGRGVDIYISPQSMEELAVRMRQRGLYSYQTYVRVMHKVGSFRAIEEELELVRKSKREDN